MHPALLGNLSRGLGGMRILDNLYPTLLGNCEHFGVGPIDRTLVDDRCVCLLYFIHFVQHQSEQDCVLLAWVIETRTWLHRFSHGPAPSIPGSMLTRKRNEFDTSIPAVHTIATSGPFRRAATSPRPRSNDWSGWVYDPSSESTQTATATSGTRTYPSEGKKSTFYIRGADC